MTVLAGDVGGTKTLLMIAECVGTRVRRVCEQRYVSADFPDFLALAQSFANDNALAVQSIESACIAVAGPVVNTPQGKQRAKVTNLPWVLDTEELARALHIPRVKLINDFQGVGYGVEALSENDVVTLQTGNAQPCGTRIVLGAGTGLGAALLVWQQGRYEVIASELGHTNFAPADAKQIALLHYLRRQFDAVSWEHVLSGPGLVRLHRFLRDSGADSANPAWDSASDDDAALISAAALEGDETARRALELFVRLYGAKAGDFALACLPTGGVYLAGGIAPKMIDKFRDGAFVHAFRAKSRMHDLLAKLPVHVIMNSAVGVLGAALVAGRS